MVSPPRGTPATGQPEPLPSLWPTHRRGTLSRFAVFVVTLCICHISPRGLERLYCKDGVLYLAPQNPGVRAGGTGHARVLH